MSRNQELWSAARERVAEAEKNYRALEEALEKRPGRRNARKLARFAVRNYTSHYYSETLEKYYLVLAKRWLGKPPISRPVRSGSVLHVMTSAYLSGGHTRIVERWIDSAPANEIHSVVITRQRKASQVPKRLRNAVAKKDGMLKIFPYLLPILFKSFQLRRIAATYETVVLHQNMTDPIPLLAFGDPKFPRPVLLYNHASHCFWIGRNAADMAIDGLDTHQDITIRKRGIANNMIISLPDDSRPHQTSGPVSDVRRSLGIPETGQVVISMASAYKYTVVLDYDFPAMLRSIFRTTPDSHVIIIGVDSGSSPEWQQLAMDYPARLHLLGVRPYKEIANLLQAADLYLDSYPFNSYTSMLDAIAIGKLPVLSLRTPLGVPPFIKESSALVDTAEELVERTDRLLKNPAEASALYAELTEGVNRLTTAEAFQGKVHEAYRRVADIGKNPSRYRPVVNEITDFDILFNEISRVRLG